MGCCVKEKRRNVTCVNTTALEETQTELVTFNFLNEKKSHYEGTHARTTIWHKICSLDQISQQSIRNCTSVPLQSHTGPTAMQTFTESSDNLFSSLLTSVRALLCQSSRHDSSHLATWSPRLCFSAVNRRQSFGDPGGRVKYGCR